MDNDPVAWAAILSLPDRTDSPTNPVYKRQQAALAAIDDREQYRAALERSRGSSWRGR
jgi:hypothetical protein